MLILRRLHASTLPRRLLADFQSDSSMEISFFFFVAFLAAFFAGIVIYLELLFESLADEPDSVGYIF